MNTAVILSKLRQYPLPVLCAILLVVVVVLYFLRSPLIDELDAANAELEQQRNAMQFNKRESQQLKAQVERGKKLLEDADRRLMDPKEVALNYDFFYRLEKATGVRIVSMGQAISTESNPWRPSLSLYRLVAYDITVEGNLVELMQFAHQVQTGNYLTRLESLSASKSGATQANAITASFKLLVLGKLEAKP